jgi:hypothetical protein
MARKAHVGGIEGKNLHVFLGRYWNSKSANTGSWALEMATAQKSTNLVTMAFIFMILI